jgi:4-cresol dehydrogenase (hydroxylating)
VILFPHGDLCWKMVARIKAALDPAGIIAPGRYEPGRT